MEVEGVGVTDGERNLARYRWLLEIYRRGFCVNDRYDIGQEYLRRGGSGIENADLLLEVLEDYARKRGWKVPLEGDPYPPRIVLATEGGAEEYDDICEAQELMDCGA